MPRLTFIVGLCGSGKTHEANFLVDLHAHYGIQPKVFDEGFLHSRTQQRELIDTLRKGSDAIVIEIAYCIPKYRCRILTKLALNVPGIDIAWVYFENDLRAANFNCRMRTNKDRNSIRKHWAINKDLTKKYVIPKGVRPLPIVRMVPARS